MVQGAHVNDQSRAGGGSDAGDFGRDVRQFALDAHRALRRPDGSIDELIHLHWRAWSLLREAPEGRADGIYGWLLAVRRTIADDLHRRAAEELELRAG